ncbi:MAG: hypothetical protein A2782_02440 [Candidatus Blackburnbacteria bacterium RIFCSPHIGHO2_01_FULL_43_15b]|uniref:NadR/Ttd14 AAA domain-containing protein n=1 Tax=Candidatus Blackburnbacteria bacterium RIFCSPHIGHO2_01_FULL_43_15b TaxID=1797513 RepID=A0A1G1V2L9_9BACT|nr:MAG: hypothetical protein A2782_02440 [Candidatus Blackburnbacteria bacterium RIFCSPHIGHO2_01_FULL_43_15b]
MLVEHCQKIALVGTSCVGKTTIFEMLRNSLGGAHNVVFVPEAARAFFEKNPGIARFSADTQEKIQDFAIEQERKVEGPDVKIMICDRSCLDTVAYTRAAGDLAGASRLLTNIAYWLPTYSAIFLLSPDGVPYQNDGVRTEDSTFRQAVHNAFVQILEENMIPHTIIEGSLEKRVAKIESVIYDARVAS